MGRKTYLSKKTFMRLGPHEEMSRDLDNLPIKKRKPHSPLEVNHRSLSRSASRRRKEKERVIRRNQMASGKVIDHRTKWTSVVLQQVIIGNKISLYSSYCLVVQANVPRYSMPPP